MIPHEKIKDNNFLCNLDMDNATREQKIAWLCQIIKNETEKPEDERDVDLISECSDYLYELSEDDLRFSEEELQQGLAKIKQNHQASGATILPMKKRRKRLIRVAIIFAATFAVLFSGISVAAKTQGYTNAWEFVSQNVDIISKMKPGDRIEDGNITLIKGEESIIYASIEELIKKENYNILYPSKLPDNVRIRKIIQQNMSDDSTLLSFQTDDIYLSFSISSKPSVSEKDLQYYEKHQTSYTTFYVDTKSDSVYQAIGYFENYEYCIVYNDYNTLISILNNLKGFDS